jgi:hypothetical protein
VSYGVYDERDSCWIGDESGPKQFDNFILARIAAQVYEDQIHGTDMGGRFVARELPQDAFRLKDQVAPRRSTLASLQRIEGRKQ